MRVGCLPLILFLILLVLLPAFLVLAMVLGDRAEDAFRQSMILSKGSLWVFWSNPLAGTITTLALFCFALPGFTALWRLANRQLMRGQRS